MPQISDDLFMFYADYFAYTAIAGIKSANSIPIGIRYIQYVDQSTYVNFADSQLAKTSLVQSLQSSYEQIYTNAKILDPMRQSFEQLANHIKEFTGSSLNTYLSAQGIKVERVYANISSLTGNPISTDNIKS